MITTRATTAFDFNAGLDAIENVTAADLGKTLTSARYAEFPAEEYAQRYARLKVLMDREGIDAALVTQQENVRYFSGYLSVLWISNFRPLTALLPADVSVPSSVLVSGQELANAKATSWVEDPRSFSPQHPPMPYLADLITEQVGASGRIGIELGFGQRLGMNVEQLLQLETLLPDVEFVDITPLAECVRMLKSPAEIALLRESCRISCAGVRAGWESLAVGKTERDVLTVIGTKMFEQGAELASTKGSYIAIMAGERMTLSNAVGTDDNRIASGDMVMIDGGANYKGYMTDYIRQAAMGPIDDEQKRWLDVAIEANHRTIAAIKPGVVASAVYDAALAVFAEHGLAEFNRMTIVGHGIGADVHELPWLGEADTVYTSETILREGMVLSIEPVLSAGEGGPLGHFIVENMVAITATGTELLTDSLSDELWTVQV